MKRGEEYFNLKEGSIGSIKIVPQGAQQFEDFIKRKLLITQVVKTLPAYIELGGAVLLSKSSHWIQFNPELLPLFLMTFCYKSII
jgi:hypothetical protein